MYLRTYVYGIVCIELLQLHASICRSDRRAVYNWLYTYNGKHGSFY